MPRLGCVFDHITGMPSGWTSFLAHYECVLDHITGAPPLRFVLSDCDFDHVTGMQALVAPLALHASTPQRARLCSRPAFGKRSAGPEKQPGKHFDIQLNNL